MAAPMEENGVDLGFIENIETFLLRSRFFPSKVGGKPAWLSLKPLPRTEELSCRSCGKPTIVLLQVYSPVTETKEAFHRTILVFVCPNPSCCKPNTNDNFRVFRSQLARDNEFYSSDPPVEKPLQTEPLASDHQPLCLVCGCAGNKRCGKCHQISYCSKEHQTAHWKASHKKFCSTDKTNEGDDGKIPLLFPEFELVIEHENYEKQKLEKDESGKMEEYKEFLKSNKAAGMLKESEAELENMSSTESENDKQLRKFKKRINCEPEQVLRYQKGQTPLWIANSSKPSDDEIPKCSCGAKRQFEFQVLPTLLSHLKVDKLEASLDWGTLCVYTCTDNCDIGNQYREEYLFKQDVQ